MGHKYDELIYSNDYNASRCHVFYARDFFAFYGWERDGKFKWRGKEKTHRENGDLNVEVGDWIVDKWGKVRKIWSDDDETIKYEDILRHATEREAENHILINDLIEELFRMKKDHADAWETYGSELCAGEMMDKEENLEKKIEELR